MLDTATLKSRNPLLQVLKLGFVVGYLLRMLVDPGSDGGTVLLRAATSPVTLSSLAAIVAVFSPISLRKKSAVRGSP